MASVRIVAKTVFVKSFWIGPIASPGPGVKSSCSDIRPMRATASTDVKAKAETHIVRMQAAMSVGTPKISVRNPATEPENVWKGVPAGSTPLLAAAQTMISATMPRTTSTHMEP